MEEEEETQRQSRACSQLAPCLRINRPRLLLTDSRGPLLLRLLQTGSRRLLTDTRWPPRRLLTNTHWPIVLLLLLPLLLLLLLLRSLRDPCAPCEHRISRRVTLLLMIDLHGPLMRRRRKSPMRLLLRLLLRLGTDG